jgi:hypothetical protein
MNIMKVLLCALVVTALVISPVLGFTADTLEVDVHEEGGAQVSFSYSLTWYERFAVFLQIADPAKEFGNAMEGITGQPVHVQEAGASSLVFSVDHFASVRNEDGSRVFVTPELRFPEADAVLHHYWFAPLVQADFSPAVTTVRFPDGSAEIWTDEETIPAITHREPRYLTADIVC